MKKIWLFFCVSSFFSITINAQGINQLWGMTQAGGNDNIGVLFSTNSTGDNFEVRNNFKYINSGERPNYMEPVEFNGKFYGMTFNGGSHSNGVIFEWDPVTNIYTKKIDMEGPGGVGPLGSLTLSSGKFYGMTNGGGTNGLGVIFEWDPVTNLYTKKIDMAAATGSHPWGSLTINAGKFYGMTSDGGLNNVGVIFEWDLVTNIYTKKIDMVAVNGRNPHAHLTFSGGKFYGMTPQGGINDVGVIFEWDPITNIYTKKIDLSNANGSWAYGSLTINAGKFYGMTSLGGANNAGAIFEWDPVTNIYTKKYDFTLAGGFNSSGNLTLNAGKFYGMTETSFFGSGFGTIFEWDPVSNVCTDKISLTAAGGSRPRGSMALSSGKFYGLTHSGGMLNSGVIFEWDPSLNVYTKKIDLNVSDGMNPNGSFTLFSGKLYGTTTYGATNNNDAGVIFEWDPATSTYTRKVYITTINGLLPYGSLTEVSGKLYGMTSSGGISWGVIFEWDPVTNVYTKKIDFNSARGVYPYGDLTLSGGKFYGMTSNGGGSGFYGVIFEWDPATNTYTKKIGFDQTNGAFPYGSLTLYNGKFYGMTKLGGSNNAGVIFEWDPATNIYTKKIELSTADGSLPFGNLVMSGSKFYGMTSEGGVNNLGVIFEWDPATNIYTKKVDFSAANGSKPKGSLLLNAGKFYGMASEGGTNGFGVVFEWDPLTNIYTKKKDFTGTDGGSPSYNTLIIVPAPVAKGNLVSCETLPAITIDNSNNNTWVPIVDNLGDIAAEINANGNNLGIVSTSLFTKNGVCREDLSNRLYLNRNITISPQTQPGSSVSVRLYIKKTELDSLRTALNSMGQPSGVASINEVDVFKNDDACSTVGALTALPLTATTGTYNSDYYLQVNISSFSSFYFANKLLTEILPVKIKSFTGKRAGPANELKWEASCNAPVVFNIERSPDGIHFETIGNLVATDCNAPFYFTDNNPFPKNNYYRLRIKETGGAINYSPVILLDANKTGPLQISVQPNLVRGSSINAALVAGKSESIELMITDVTGRKLLSRQLTIQIGMNNLSVNTVTLAQGIYWLYAIGKDGRTNVVRFVKQ